ncbi:hypothetical protein JOM56_015742 [Amanita muscaria]
MSSSFPKRHEFIVWLRETKCHRWHSNSRSSSNAHNKYAFYYKLQMSTDSKQEEWVVAPAPLLYKKRQVRAQVFGFPVTQDDIRAWAEAHNIPEEDDYYRRQDAWKAQSMCIVIGSNLNAKDMERAQNLELIKSLYDAVDMGKRPGWFYVSQG